MGENPMLDAMLSVLSDMSQEDKEEEVSLSSSHENEPDQGVLQPDIVNNQENQEEEAGQSSSHEDAPEQGVLQPDIAINQQTNSPLRRYLSSGSARKRRRKPQDCIFCNSYCEKVDLATHLQTHEICFALYKRFMHCTTVNGIICKLYKDSCLFCETRGERSMQYHLSTNVDCKERYFAYFSVQSVSMVLTTRQTLLRESMKSRRSLARSIDNKKQRDKKRKSAEPIEIYMNRYKEETAFSNYKFCSRCGANTLTAEVLPEPVEGVDIGAKRMEKYWQCGYCKVGKSISEMGKPKDIWLQSVRKDGVLVFSPVADQVENQIVDVNDVRTARIVFPTSPQCLSVFGVGTQWSSLSAFQVQQLVYSNKLLDTQLLSLLYSHQMSKYANLSKTAKLFIGKIADPELKTLTGLRDLPEDNRLAGSTEWRKEFLDDLKWRMHQLGKNCVAISFEVPMDNLAISATTLVQNCQVVTAEFVGRTTLDFEKRYFIHNHENTEECSEQCEKKELKDYLLSNNVEVTGLQWISSYISYSELVYQSAIRNIIQCPSSKLLSDDYQFTVSFKTNGTIVICGVVWPQIMKKINFQSIDQETTDEDRIQVRQDLVTAVDGSIGTSCKTVDIKRRFQTSDKTSKIVGDLVKSHQVHVCDSLSRNHPMPSLQSMITENPLDGRNIIPCKHFIVYMKDKLHEIPYEVLRNMSTQEFLDQVWDEAEQTLTEDQWDVSFDNNSFTFTFYPEPKLLELRRKFAGFQIAALYQFALGCKDGDKGPQFILRRNWLLDCFTEPYCHNLLRTIEGPVIVKPILSMDEFSAMLPHQNNSALPSHGELSLIEAVSLSDRNKLRMKSSTSTETVKVKKSSYFVFRRTDEASENSFSHDGKFYDLLLSNVNKFDNRLNGKSLLMSELCSWYEYLGVDKSIELFDLYQNQIHKISETETISISNQNMPELIISSTGHVLKKRKVAKIIKHEVFLPDSEEHKYAQVLLYGSYQSISELTNKKVEELFNEEVEGVNVISRNRRKFLRNVRKEQ